MSHRQMVKTVPDESCILVQMLVFYSNIALQIQRAAYRGIDGIQGVLIHPPPCQESAHYWTIELHLLWPLQILFFLFLTIQPQRQQTLF